ncbi:MAG: hypothetical protein FJ088_05720, partial [Deltaproteobacteria bacterium]|nr:hypothetical protein [Deltaproteobacteria bacterium]
MNLKQYRGIFFSFFLCCALFTGGGCSSDPDLQVDSKPATVDEDEFLNQILAGSEGDPCTTDAQCNDNNKCTNETCTPNGCHYEPVNCDDGNVCTWDPCSPVKGCYHTNMGKWKVCDDNNACTNPDKCNGLGSC